MNESKIRKAKPGHEAGIHEAHMRRQKFVQKFARKFVKTWTYSGERSIFEGELDKGAAETGMCLGWQSRYTPPPNG